MRITYLELNTVQFYSYPANGPDGSSLYFGELKREGKPALAIRRTRYRYDKHAADAWHAAPLPSVETTKRRLHCPIGARRAEAVADNAWRPFDPLLRWYTVRIACTGPARKAPVHFRGVTSPDEVTFICSAEKHAWLAVDPRPHRLSYRYQRFAEPWLDDRGRTCTLADYYAPDLLFGPTGEPIEGATLQSVEGYTAKIVKASRVKLSSGDKCPDPWN